MKEFFTSPPFSKRLFPALSITYAPPIVVRTADHGFLRWNEDPQQCLSTEVLTPELDKIQRFLWCAGLPRPARSLHRQRLIGRTICLTERVQEHLVWHESRIFLKPLPCYLLDYGFWKQHLCGSSRLYQHSCGLLLSYIWLVSSETDFRMAQEVGVIPHSIEWTAWQILLEDLLHKWNSNSRKYLISQRYHYGELRLSRIKLFHRFAPPLLTLQRRGSGFIQSSAWYNDFISRNFRWLLAVFAYVSVILSAMQVGLASDYLANDKTFQKSTKAFALGSILFVLLIAVMICTISVFLFCYNILAAIRFCEQLKNDTIAGKLNTEP